MSTMNPRARIKWYAALCVTALALLAAQEMDFGPTVNLQRDIVILTDGVADEEMPAMLKSFLHQRFGLPVRVEKNSLALPAAARPERRQWELRELVKAVCDRVRGGADASY